MGWGGEVVHGIPEVGPFEVADKWIGGAFFNSDDILSCWCRI